MVSGRRYHASLILLAINQSLQSCDRRHEPTFSGRISGFGAHGHYGGGRVQVCRKGIENGYRGHHALVNVDRLDENKRFPHRGRLNDL